MLFSVQKAEWEEKESSTQKAMFSCKTSEQSNNNYEERGTFFRCYFSNLDAITFTSIVYSEQNCKRCKDVKTAEASLKNLSKAFMSTYPIEN